MRSKMWLILFFLLNSSSHSFANYYDFDNYDDDYNDYRDYEQSREYCCESAPQKPSRSYPSHWQKEKKYEPQYSYPAKAIEQNHCLPANCPRPLYPCQQTQVQKCYDCCSICPCETPPCAHIFVEGDFLYWKAQEDGLAFAITGLVPAPGEEFLNGNSLYVQNKWSKGYRVGVGLQFPCSLWDIYAAYTRFHSSANRSETAPPGETLFTTFGPPLGTRLADATTAHWQLKYKTADIELGYLFGCKDFFFRPFAGVRGIWTHENYNINYSLTEDAFLQNVDNEQYFKGVGPRIGVNHLWYCFRWLGQGNRPASFIFDQINLFADAGIACVWGRYLVKRTDLVDDITTVNVENHFNSIKPIFDVKAGVGWDFPLNCSNIRLFIEGAFEAQLFLKHNQMYRFFSNAFAGTYANIGADLSLYGFTLRAGLFF